MVGTNLLWQLGGYAVYPPHHHCRSYTFPKDSIVAFKTEQPKTEYWAKVLYAVREMAVEVHVRGDLNFPIQTFYLISIIEKETVSILISVSDKTGRPNLQTLIRTCSALQQ